MLLIYTQYITALWVICFVFAVQTHCTSVHSEEDQDFSFQAASVAWCSHESKQNKCLFQNFIRIWLRLRKYHVSIWTMFRSTTLLILPVICIINCVSSLFDHVLYTNTWTHTDHSRGDTKSFLQDIAEVWSCLFELNNITISKHLISDLFFVLANGTPSLHSLFNSLDYRSLVFSLWMVHLLKTMDKSYTTTSTSCDRQLPGAKSVWPSICRSKPPFNPSWSIMGDMHVPNMYQLLQVVRLVIYNAHHHHHPPP